MARGIKSPLAPGEFVGGSIPIRKELKDKHKKWKRAKLLIENSEDDIAQAYCWQLPNESSADLIRRRDTFGTTFVNMAQDLVSAPGNAVFRNGYDLTFKNPNSLLSTFADNVTRSNDPVPFARYLKDHVSVGLRTYGTIFTVIDKPPIIARSRKEERENGSPYLNNIHPLDVLNYQYVDKSLLWFAYKVNWQPVWKDPTKPAPDSEEVTVIWTKSEMIVLDSNGDTMRDKTFAHNYGFVPVVVQGSFLPNPNDVLGQSAFEQTSNMLISANNMLHLAVWELMKHGSALLMMHEESVTGSNMGNDETGETLLKTQAQSKVLMWGGEKEPNYLIKELEVEKLNTQADMYFRTAVENERDLKSVVKKGDGGIVAQSGLAKAIDREPLEGNLVALADDLEIYASKVFSMVSKILGVKNDANLEFDTDYDLRGEADKWSEVEAAIRVKYGQITPTGLATKYKDITPMLTNDPDLQARINEEIDDNVGDPDKLLTMLMDSEDMGGRIGDNKNDDDDDNDDNDIGGN